MPINDQISGQHLTAYGTGFSTDLVRIVIYLSAMWRLALISLLVSLPLCASLSLSGSIGESPVALVEEPRVKWIRIRIRLRTKERVALTKSNRLQCQPACHIHSSALNIKALPFISQRVPRSPYSGKGHQIKLSHIWRSPRHVVKADRPYKGPTIAVKYDVD